MDTTDGPVKFTGQPGPQTSFLEAPESVVIFGGSAFGGKTYGLLLDPLRYVKHSKFSAVIFRRTTPEITNEGGLWDTSQEIYPLVGGIGMSSRNRWRFPSGATIRFAHMEHEDDRFSWSGSQIPYIGFEEGTQFTSKQFWHMLGRLRSVGDQDFPRVIRVTTNPDPDSWLAEFVAWWIDQETGYAIEGRSGLTRYFSRLGDRLVTGGSREEVIDICGPECDPKSYTFIRSKIEDNVIGLSKDPGYMANLMSLPRVDREQLRYGNWKIRPAAGMFFRREYFKIIDAAPEDVAMRVRFWDRAASEKQEGRDPDATYSVLMTRLRSGGFVIEQGLKMFATAHAVERAMVNLANQDPPGTIVAFNQDPGSAGKGEAQQAALAVAGKDVRFWTVTGDKETRAKPVSSQAEAGNISLVRGAWNSEFLTVLENFPEGTHDDEVDALSGAFTLLSAPPSGPIISFDSSRRATILRSRRERAIFA